MCMYNSREQTNFYIDTPLVGKPFSIISKFWNINFVK
jgi:hypothetical protein